MIKHAAIKHGKVIFVGKMHIVCMSVMWGCGIHNDEVQKCPQGFVTDEGKFVDRREAYQIALANNQIVHKHGIPEDPVLYSEDLFLRADRTDIIEEKIKRNGIKYD